MSSIIYQVPYLRVPSLYFVLGSFSFEFLNTLLFSRERKEGKVLTQRYLLTKL